MNNTKISIIVPIYNVEAYIRECFDSIAAQTYKGELECIFVDDCGQDKSVEILEGLMADYHGDIVFSLIHHEHNKGLSGARNTGIKNATGEYLYFLDSDDTITPDCIEKLVTLAMKYPGVEVVQGSARAKTDWLQVKRAFVPEYSDDFGWIRKTMLKRYVIPLTAWNKLVSRAFVLAHELYFVEGMIHEDEIWNFMMAKYVHRIAFCSDASYNYRENESGIIHQVKQNPRRYLPIVDYMSRHTSVPYLCCELECMKSLLENGDNQDYLDEYLSNVPCSKRLMKLVLVLKDRVNHSTKYEPMGLVWRVTYMMMAKWLDLKYGKCTDLHMIKVEF